MAELPLVDRAARGPRVVFLLLLHRREVELSAVGARDVAVVVDHVAVDGVVGVVHVLNLDAVWKPLDAPERVRLFAPADVDAYEDLFAFELDAHRLADVAEDFAARDASRRVLLQLLEEEFRVEAVRVEEAARDVEFRQWMAAAARGAQGRVGVERVHVGYP